MVTALYKKSPFCAVTASSDGALVTCTGTPNETVADSVAAVNVCCATPPATTAPSCCRESVVLSGNVAPVAGARLPWNTAT